MKNIELSTVVHYQILASMHECFQFLNNSNLVADKAAEEVISLPVYLFITKEEIQYVVRAIRR